MLHPGIGEDRPVQAEIEAPGPLPVHLAQEGGLVEHVYVHDRKGWHWAWRLTRIGLLIVMVTLVLAAAIVWIWRKPIADDYIRDELARRGVHATYTLDRVGFRTQQVSNLSIGDPANPDLTVRRATIQLRIKWNGSVEVYRVVARGALRDPHRRAGERVARDGQLAAGRDLPLGRSRRHAGTLVPVTTTSTSAVTIVAARLVERGRRQRDRALRRRR